MARVSITELRRYAAIGVQSEIARLQGLFPAARTAAPTAMELPAKKRGKRRRKLTAAEKALISKRMKESWAAKRKAAKKP